MYTTNKGLAKCSLCIASGSNACSLSLLLSCRRSKLRQYLGNNVKMTNQCVLLAIPIVILACLCRCAGLCVGLL